MNNHSDILQAPLSENKFVSANTTVSENRTDSADGRSQRYNTSKAREFCELVENKPGVVRLRMKHGWGGYGMYCGLLNMLAEQPALRYVNDAEIIAFKLGADAEIVRSVIEDFGLFATETDDEAEYIYAPLLRNFLTTGNRTSQQPIVTGTLCSSESYQHNQIKRDDKSNRDFDLEANRERLRNDSEWLTRVAKNTGMDEKLMPDVFDYFADYVRDRDDVFYKTEQDMTRHLRNWLKKGCGSHAMKLAKDAAKRRREQAERETRRRERAEEARQQRENAITYEEYCRRKGIESTGSLARDILNNLEKRRGAKQSQSLPERPIPARQSGAASGGHPPRGRS